MLDTRNAVDIIKSIDSYLEYGGDDITTILDINRSIMKDVDRMETVVNGVATTPYRNDMLKQIQNIRQALMDIIDDIDDMYNQTNR